MLGRRAAVGTSPIGPVVCVELDDQECERCPCDGHGVPLAVRLTGANRNDSQEALALVDAIPPVQGEARQTSTGLEPAASDVTGRVRRQQNAADPGESGSVVPHRGHSMPAVDACPGISCKLLQAATPRGRLAVHEHCAVIVSCVSVRDAI